MRLGQERSGIRLARGVWEQPNVQADPLLHRALRTVAEQVEMKQIVDAPLVYAIRTHLPGALQSGAFSAEDIAIEFVTIGMARVKRLHATVSSLIPATIRCFLLRL